MPTWLLGVNPRLIGAAAALLAFLGVCAFAWLQTERLDTAKREFAAFQATVKALGDVAEAKARAQEKSDLAVKQRIDNENIRLRGDNAALVSRMRQSSPRGGDLPAAPASSSRPDLACFDRGEYQREDGIAIAKLLEGARSLADEGTACAIDLNSARAWAVDVK